jgi:RNA polymerase sigma-70 factor (ECF subfamily)
MRSDRADRRLLDEIAAVYRNKFEAFLFTATAYLGDADAGWDAVQDGFATAVRRRWTYRREGTLEAWLWAVVVSAVRDHSRRAQRLPEPVGDMRLDGGFADVLVEPPKVAALRAALARLPERQRLAVFLHYYADLDYPTVARVLGISTGTVAASLNAARAALRTRLTEVAR